MNDPWTPFYAVEHQLYGWWHPELCRVLGAVNQLHAAHGLSGWIVEFGVFHGRSLAALALMARDGERVLGVDCFELGHYNTSNSGGRASMEIAQRSLQLVGVPLDRVSLVTANLAELDAFGLQTLLESLPGGYRPVRVIHIDAGHEVWQATQDLETIVPHLDDLGVIFLDDVYHYQWPEVALAFSRFLDRHAGWDVIGCLHNRVILVRKDAGPLYREALMRLLGPPWQTFLGRPYFVAPP